MTRLRLSAPSDLDPETSLLLANLADAQLAALTGAGTLRRVAQAIAAEAYALGRQHAGQASGSRHGGIVTVAEYAARTGCTERTAERRAQAGRIPARRTSAGWLIEVEEEAG